MRDEARGKMTKELKCAPAGGQDFRLGIDRNSPGFQGWEPWPSTAPTAMTLTFGLGATRASSLSTDLVENGRDGDQAGAPHLRSSAPHRHRAPKPRAFSPTQPTPDGITKTHAAPRSPRRRCGEANVCAQQACGAS